MTFAAMKRHNKDIDPKTLWEQFKESEENFVKYKLNEAGFTGGK